MPKALLKNMKQQGNVLVVCHGAVCRSPLAGAVLQQAGWQVRVRACKVYEGTSPPAAKKVREYASVYHLDLSTHRASTVTEQDVVWAATILYMDNKNLEALLSRFPRYQHKFHCLAKEVGLDKIKDPGFMKRGPELTKVLHTVVKAAATWANKKPCSEEQGLSVSG